MEVEQDNNYIEPNDFEEIENLEDVEPVVEEPPKKRRGRPRKNPLPEVKEEVTINEPVRKGRGRPKKNAVSVQATTNRPKNDEVTVLPGIGQLEEDNYDEPEETILPGITEENDERTNYYSRNDNGLEQNKINTFNTSDNFNTFQSNNNISNMNSVSSYNSNNYNSI